MPPVGFEPTIPAGERPWIYAFDRSATGTGKNTRWTVDIVSFFQMFIPWCLQNFRVAQF